MRIDGYYNRELIGLSDNPEEATFLLYMQLYLWMRWIICIDGKTMRSNKRGEEKASHVVSAWSKEDGFCLGQKSVGEKSNEITAIPELLEKIRIKGQIITIDAMGTQTAIAEKIRQKRADYVLALKKNQSNLYKDVKEYFSDAELQEDCKKRNAFEKKQKSQHYPWLRIK